MKKVLLAVLLMACASSVYARGRFTDYVNVGGQRVYTGNSQSFNYVQRSFPGATVSVYNVGTANLQTIYSDSGGTPLANPFTAGSDGQFTFWTDSTQFDITFTGTGITTSCGTGSLPACVGAFTWTNKTYNTGDFTTGVTSVAATLPVVTSAATGAITLSCPTCVVGTGGTTAYQVVQEEGVDLTRRITLNFAGAALTAADSGGTKTTVTLSQSPAGATSVVGTTRTITTTSPITIGGGASADLSADRTIACPTCVTTTSQFYNTMQEEGSSLIQRTTMNFVGNAITAADSGGKTVVTLSQSPAAATSVVGTTRQLTGGYGIATTCVPWSYGCTIGDFSADRMILWDYSMTFANMTALGNGTVVPSSQTTNGGFLFTGVTGSDSNGTYLTAGNPTGQRTVTLPDASSSLPIYPQFITYTGPTAARTVTYPDANFSAARIDAGQTFVGTNIFDVIEISAGSAVSPGIIYASNTANGFYFVNSGATGVGFGYSGGADNANHKDVEFSVSGITANNMRTLTVPDWDTTLLGSVGTVNLTAQNASIGATNIVAAAAAGQYQVCWTQQITTAAGVSSSLLTTIGWNNGAAKTATVASLNGGAYQTTADTSNTVNSEMSNCLPIRVAAATNITYATTYASNAAGAMQYALRITVTRLQ